MNRFEEYSPRDFVFLDDLPSLFVANLSISHSTTNFDRFHDPIKNTGPWYSLFTSCLELSTNSLHLRNQLHQRRLTFESHISPTLTLDHSNTTVKHFIDTTSSKRERSESGSSVSLIDISLHVQPVDQNLLPQAPDSIAFLCGSQFANSLADIVSCVSIT